MSRAQCLLPDGPNYQRDDFLEGLQQAGFEVLRRVDRPAPGDALVIWNRPFAKEPEAQRFESAGAGVLVVENGYFGKHWRSEKWFAMGWGHYGGAGRWPNGGPERWDSWNVEMHPWATGGAETVILAQRGIGEQGIASPAGWAEAVQKQIGGRIRQHPGAGVSAVPLAEDLENAARVVTWNSAAALHALLLGVPVWHGFEHWIGAGAARPLSEWGVEPELDSAARLATMRRLAWAMWSAEEVRTGLAFRSLMCVS